MIRVHPIHDRARVVVEAGYYADEHVLKVQVLDEPGQWAEKGAHCVVENPEREAADLAAEFLAVSTSMLPERGRPASRPAKTLLALECNRVLEGADADGPFFVLESLSDGRWTERRKYRDREHAERDAWALEPRCGR